MWRNRFGGGVGPVVRQNTEWTNEWTYSLIGVWNLSTHWRLSWHHARCTGSRWSKTQQYKITPFFTKLFISPLSALYTILLPSYLSVMCTDTIPLNINTNDIKFIANHFISCSMHLWLPLSHYSHNLLTSYFVVLQQSNSCEWGWLLWKEGGRTDHTQRRTHLAVLLLKYVD